TPTRRTDDDRTVRRTSQIFLLVAPGGWPARLPQIPARIFSRPIGHRSLVINRSCNHHHVGSLGDKDRVASPHFDIGTGVGPLLDVRRNVNHQPAAGWNVLQLVQRGLPLLRSRAAGNFLIRVAAVRHQFEFGSLHLNIADEVSPALLLKFTHLHAFENRSVGIGIRAQSAGALDNRTKPFSFADSITPWMYHFS